MPCFRPLTAYQTGAGAVVFSELKRNDVRKQLLLPCGQCVGCRLERSRQWATRCVHEAQMHKHNAFLTLTYNEENLLTPSLRHRDWQLFMKKLRKLLSSSSNQMQSELDPVTGKPKCSFYMAGEYGTQNRRPHFHACLFGADFNDKKYWRTTSTKSKLWTSDTLDALWGNGFTSIGEVNFQSAAYIARYIMAKQTGDLAGKHYEHINEETGEITNLLPEYNKMSLKPAIGKRWLEKYEPDVYPEGEVLTNKHKVKAPKYYDKQYKKENPEQYEEMKMKREIQALEYRNDNTPQRLQAKERVKLAQLNQLLRKI